MQVNEVAGESSQMDTDPEASLSSPKRKLSEIEEDQPEKEHDTSKTTTPQRMISTPVKKKSSLPLSLNQGSSSSKQHTSKRPTPLKINTDVRL